MAIIPAGKNLARPGPELASAPQYVRGLLEFGTECRQAP